MKKCFKWTLTMLIVTILLAVNLPISVLASNVNNNTVNGKKSKNDDSGVVIMYKQKSSGIETKRKSSNNTPAFLQDLNVENTVKFNNSKTSSVQTRMAKSTTASESDDLTISLVKSEKYSPDDLIRMLSKEESVIYAQKNYRVKSASITNDTYQRYQWAIENVGQNKGKKDADINPEAISNQSSEEKVIVVLDTGVDYTNPELKNKIWNNKYEKTGLLDGEHGYDFCRLDSDPMDENGHGTHVSGIIAAEANNNSGITGAVLDKSNIKIMPIRILDEDGYGNLFDVVSAYNYIFNAQKLGTNIVAINNSWGGIITKDDYILKTVINIVGNGPESDGNGALSICAAGNEFLNTDEYIYSPAGLDSDYIVSVAASNEKDELVYFSNFGKYSVDIAAPGADILSTVFYNCFNPSIYNKDEKQKLCTQYENFDSGLGNFKYNASAGKVTTSSDSYFGTSGKSLKWSFDAKGDNLYFLAIKFNGEMEDQYFSTMAKVVTNSKKMGSCGFLPIIYDYDDIDFEDLFADDEPEDFDDEDEYDDYEEYQKIISKKIISNKRISNKNISKRDSVEAENVWTHCYDYVYGGSEEGTKTLLIVYYAEEDSNVSFYLDDYAVSNGIECEEDFGKYDFYNGTSMATPYVAAAAGVASNIKNETAINRKARVLGATRQVDGLKDKVVTNGVLDFKYLANPNPTINSAKIDSDGKITINIKNVTDDAEILINNKKVEATKVGEEQFVVVDKDLKNKTVTISLKYGDNVISNKFYLAVGKEFNHEAYTSDLSNIQNLFTDGKDMYVYSNKAIYKYINNDSIFYQIDAGLDESMEELLEIEDGEFIEFFDLADTSDFVIIDEKIYTIVTFDGFLGPEYILAYHDMKAEGSGWKKLTELPDECYLYMTTLGSYNGNLYVIGGYDLYEEKASKNMYEYNIKTKKWTQKANLPEGRYAAKANQVGSNLVLSFGGKDDGTVPCNLIYNGKKWKKSAANIEINSGMQFFYDKKYYSPSVGLVAGGLIYSGVNAEKLGNTFYYDVESDTFKSSGYMVNDIDNTIGVAVKDKYYIFDKYTEETLSLKSIPVKSSLLKLTVRYPSTGIRAWVNGNLYSKSNSNGNVYNTYYYMPGDIVGFKLTDIPGYYYNHFKVNGKEVNGYLYNGNIRSNTEIKVTKAEISKLIKLDKTSAELTSFNTLKLNATLNDKNATAIKWKSSNTNYATVSAKGVVTPKWAGNGKTVTITANTTIYGRNVAVECKIRIKTPSIQNMRATNTTNSSISFIWNAVSGADGYEIYQYNYTTKKYELKKTQKGNSVTMSNLKASTLYNFQVLAYKMKDNKKCSTTRATISCTTSK